jgi:two-component system response regulator TctD
VRLLLVEDDLALATAVSGALKRRGIQSDVAETVGDAEQMLRAAQYAAILLDLGLPDGDGIGLLRGLRAAQNPIPVLAITARTALDARIAGLNAGADDYVLKPFDVDELVARLHAVLRRQGALAGSSLTAGNLSFDTASGDLVVADNLVILSARERQLIGLLLRRLGQVVSKQLAEDQLYGLTEPVGSNAIEVHAHRLRRKLEAAGATVRIETIRGVGYMMRPAPIQQS